MLLIYKALLKLPEYLRLLLSYTFNKYNPEITLHIPDVHTNVGNELQTALKLESDLSLGDVKALLSDVKMG